MNNICNSYAGAIFYAWPLSCTICVQIFRLDYGSYCNQAVPCVQTGPQLISVQYMFEMFGYKRVTTQKIAQIKCEKQDTHVK